MASSSSSSCSTTARATIVVPMPVRSGSPVPARKTALLACSMASTRPSIVCRSKLRATVAQAISEATSPPR
jgi:hypothetical protein